MKKVNESFLTFLIGVSQIYAWASTYYLPAVIAQLVAEEMELSYFSVIGGFSWALLIGGLFAPRIGAWIDQEGGRRPLTVGSLLMGGGLIVLSQTNGLVIWYIAWSVIGLGMGLGLFNAAFAALGRFFGHDAKRMIVRITLISGFATFIWPIATYLIEHLGWRNTVLCLALPHILLWAPLFFVWLPNWVPEHFEEPAPKSLVVPEKVKFIFSLLAIYAVLRAIVGTTISVNILDMFTGLGLTLAGASFAAALIGPSQIMGRLLEIYGGYKINPIHSSMFWTILLPVAISILLIIGPSSAVIFAVIYGMSNGVLTITMGILPMVLFGTNGYAKLLGKLALPVLLSQAATPLLVAPIIEYGSASLIFILASILGVLAFFCLFAMSSMTKCVAK